jgi:hypothetical protein
MKSYEGVMSRSTYSWPRYQLEVSGQLHAPVALPLGEQSSTHWIGGWVDPRTDLDDVEKRQILPIPGFELRPLGRPARSANPAPWRVSWCSYSIFEPSTSRIQGIRFTCSIKDRETKLNREILNSFAFPSLTTLIVTTEDIWHTNRKLDYVQTMRQTPNVATSSGHLVWVHIMFTVPRITHLERNDILSYSPCLKGVSYLLESFLQCSLEYSQSHLAEEHHQSTHRPCYFNARPSWCSWTLLLWPFEWWSRIHSCTMRLSGLVDDALSTVRRLYSVERRDD